jgi:hypothetical protein
LHVFFRVLTHVSSAKAGKMQLNQGRLKRGFFVFTMKESKLNFQRILILMFFLIFSSAANAFTLNPTLDSDNGHYYQVISFSDIGNSPDWQQAENYAENATFNGVHGTLATIPNSSVDDFLWNLVVSSSNQNDLSRVGGIFLGGQLVNGNWEWINGQAFNYVHWADGEPNNQFDNESYLMYWWGNANSNPGWNDTNINSDYPPEHKNTTWGFLVEFSPESQTSKIPSPGTIWLVSIGLVSLRLIKKRL